MFVTFKVLSSWLMLLRGAVCRFARQELTFSRIIRNVKKGFAYGTNSGSMKKHVWNCLWGPMPHVWLPIDPSWNTFEIFYSNVFQLEMKFWHMTSCHISSRLKYRIWFWIKGVVFILRCLQYLVSCY